MKHRNKAYKPKDEYYSENGRESRLVLGSFPLSWEQRKLSEMADIVGGGTPSTSNPEYWDGEIDWYAPAEMEGQRYATGSVRKITELGLQKSSATMLPAGKTVLFTSRAGIGKMAILQRSAATNQGFQSIVLKDGYNPYFIYSMGSQIKEKAESVASGSTFLEISGKMLGNLVLSIPTEAEQGKIADHFRTLDNLITLHQRKVLGIKNSYLTKIGSCLYLNNIQLSFLCQD
jgi:type I restriction enzyme S subunit